MKKISIAICAALTLISGRIAAQSEETSFSSTGRGGTATSFVTDYQAIGINPANLGFDTKFGFAIGVGEFGYALYSDALVRDDVRGILWNSSDTITPEEQETLAREFLDAGITMNVDAMPVGFSVRIPKLGTLGFAIKGNMSYYTRFAGQAANIVWEGYNYTEYIDTVIWDGSTFYGVAYEPLSLGELFEDTEIRLNISTEFNFAYGRKIFGDTDGLSMYGGVGYKYILGLAYLDLNANTGAFSGTAALGLDLLELEPGETLTDITTSPYEPVGTGHGFDLGLSMKLKDVLTVGAALVDIGQVTYTANTLIINDFVLDTIRFSGMTTTDPLQLVSDILDGENLIEYNPGSTFSVALPTKLRLGGSLKVSDFLDLGADFILPMNQVAGNYVSPVFGVGAELKVLKVLHLSTGISAGGGYAYNIPGGIGIDLGLWEAGIATRDMMTWFGEASPTVSFAMGFFRFKI